MPKEIYHNFPLRKACQKVDCGDETGFVELKNGQFIARCNLHHHYCYCVPVTEMVQFIENFYKELE